MVSLSVKRLLHIKHNPLILQEFTLSGINQVKLKNEFHHFHNKITLSKVFFIHYVASEQKCCILTNKVQNKTYESILVKSSIFFN